MPLVDKPAFLPDEVYRKISNDNIDEAVKNEFLTACLNSDCETLSDERLGAGSNSIESVYDAFSKGRQQSGTPLILAPSEKLGRITNLRNAAGYIAKGLKQSVDDVLQMFYWLNGLSDPKPTPSQSDASNDWFEELKAAIDPKTGLAFAISPPVCWLFRSLEGNHDANDDMKADLDCLPCRLGLPDLLNDDSIYEVGLDYLCLVVEASNADKVRASNFCHSGYLGVRDIWEPGGMTAPIPYGPDGCVKKSGLPEIICDAVAYAHVVDPIRIVRT